MSISRNIIFLCETKSPMVELIHKAAAEIHEETKVNGYEPTDLYDTIVYSSCIFVPKDSEFGNDPIEYHGNFKELKKKPKLRSWMWMGGSGTTYRDNDGQEYSYPVPYFNRLMDKILKSGIENDVTILCKNDIGGTDNKETPEWVKKWNGKFL